MSVILQKGGDFMTTLIKTPFKRKRRTIAGGDDVKRSPSQPRSARGTSTVRSNSLASSSVNSCCDDDDDAACDSAYVVPINNSSNNIYVDIDDGDDEHKSDLATNSIPPALPQANSIPLKVSTINECVQLFEQCDEMNCSKNNLLLIDDHMMTSIDNHLNSIELINKNLDKLMATQDLIEHESLDETVPADVRAEKKKLKEKIAEKIKMLKEARNGANGATKGSFTSRFKNILRQSSQEEATGTVKKKFLSSFRKKSPSVDESEEVFEEILKENLQLVTDLDETESKGNEKSKIKKFMNSVKNLKIKKLSQYETKICQKCSKKYNVNDFGRRIHHSPSTNDLTREFSPSEELCVCSHNDIGDDDDDGIFLKNIEYKDVSRHA